MQSQLAADLVHAYVGAFGVVFPQIKDAGGFLDHLEPDVRQRIDGRVRHMRVRKGQIVIDHGSDGGDVYCVMEGEFDVCVYSPQGREVYLRRISRGALFGEYAALDGGRRSATVVAASDALLSVICRADFVDCLTTSPTVTLWLARQLAVHVRELTEKIFELSALNVRSRLHCELMRLCLAAGVTANTAIIDPAPTHADLANRIGTHREAVTRELNDLATLKIVNQKHRRLAILDVARLSQLVEVTGGDLGIAERRDA